MTTAPDLQEIPDPMGQIPAMEDAMIMASRANLNVEELE